MKKFSWICASIFVMTTMTLNGAPRTSLFSNEHVAMKNTPEQSHNIDALRCAPLALGTRADSEEAITEAPSGETVSYSRDSYEYSVFMGTPLGPTLFADFATSIVYCDNNEVYFKNPVSELVTDTYLKGTRDGNTITCSFPQVIFQEEGAKPYYIDRLKFIITNEETGNGLYFPDPDSRTITFTMNDDGTVTMEESEAFADDYIEPVMIMGVTDYDGNWVGYGSCNQVYTPFTSAEVTMPADADVQDYLVRFNQYAGRYVKVAFVDDKVYVGNLFDDAPESCVIGTIDGDKIIFKAHQYVGICKKYSGYAYLWAVKYEWIEDPVFGDYFGMVPMEEIVFEYDATNKTFTSENAMIINLEDDSLAYIDIYDMPDFSKADLTAKPARPMNPVFDAVQEYNPEQYYGYGRLAFYLPMLDVNGNLLDTEKMYYNVWLEGAVYELTPAKYEELSESISDIPYNFVDTESYGGYDVKASGIAHVIYTYEPDMRMSTAGLQQFYRCDDGTLLASDLVFYDETGSVLSTFDSSAVEVIFTDLNGVRISSPDKGIYIKTTVLSDGTRKSQKVVVR